MFSRYWVGGFCVDLSRNQITQNQQSQTIAPKALAVLTYLAENQGRVVSHDELLAKVWQNTVVTPNTLQRSIAQLRKALGDDGKGQTYIKTHAKQGYCLECDVRWGDNTESSGSNHTQEIAADGSPASETHRTKANKSVLSPPSLRWIVILAVILILGVIGYQLIVPKQSAPLTFDNLRSLTSTDDKEFDATYTPDGKYIVFHRYLDHQCGNKLWAKNISTQEEIQLTKDWGSYGLHSFSEDGKKLIFVETESCDEPVNQKNCYDLVSLDFEKALESPQQPSLILQCQNSRIANPKWLSDDNIALMHATSNRWKLINYSISKNESSDLYNLDDGNLTYFAYSAKDELIAVTSIRNDGQHYIDMLKPNGRIVSSHPIERPPEIAKFRPIYPIFDPLNKQLFFSTGKQLFTLSNTGKVAKISLPFDENMVPSEFHPDGKKLLLIKGRYDSDIVLQSINQLTPLNPLNDTTQSQMEQPEFNASFERSIVADDYAVFQPGGELIAFRSERSGEDQLWLSDGNGPRQLTQFPLDSYISGIDWAADGKSLLVSANGALTQVFLDSSQTIFPLPYPVVRLFQWDSENNSALLLARIQGIFKLVEYDLHHSEIKEITDKPVLWALKSEDGRLIYKDYLDQFWQPGPAEDQHIKSLDGQGTKSKSFVISGNTIFAINSENQLWSYDLHSESFKVLGEVSEKANQLTDINQQQLLITVEVSEKKEVVELSLSE